MKIAIVGTGNIAYQMGRRLHAQGLEICQVIGRNSTVGNELALELGSVFSKNFDLRNLDCDAIVIAVSDKAIEKVAQSLNNVDSTIIHTSGSINIDVLPGDSIGVLWPLFSITRKRELDWKKIPLVTESSDNKAKNILAKLCDLLGGEQFFLSSKQISHAQLLAVFTNNFTNHFFHLIEEHQDRMKIDKKMFHSIIEDTFDTILTSDAKENNLFNRQTGPAIRKDKISMERHKEMLSKNPQLKKLYKTFSSSILNTYYGEEL